MILDFFQGLWFLGTHWIALLIYGVLAFASLVVFHTERPWWDRVWVDYVIAVVSYLYLAYWAAYGLILIGQGIQP